MAFLIATRSKRNSSNRCGIGSVLSAPWTSLGIRRFVTG